MSTKESLDETVRRPMDRPSRPMALGARLSVVYPRALVASKPLATESLVLGRRSGDGGLKLDHETVSRRHCEVRFDAASGCHVACELGSRNGSRVDGRDLTADEALVLHDGSILRVGDVLLVYELALPGKAEDAEAVSRDAVPGDALVTRKLRSQLASAATDPSPVLLIGATGTGKEFLAREIHRLSRRQGDFVAVNCAALSPQLIESQLFGHKKGAFTGAQSSEEGLFRSANRGTIFLDEIGELSLDMQPKLLRVVQEREVHPVGETRPVAIDVRIVSATLRDLTEMIEPGRFRRDLYARLSPWEIRVPEIAQRRVDLLSWLDRLHRRFHLERAPSAAVPALELEPSVAERLLLAEWPDNLRGLDRLVHRIATDPDTLLEHLPEPAAATADEAAARPATKVAGRKPRPSKDELAAVLEEHGGSVRATAKHYGRDRRQIYRWMEQFGLREDD